MADETNSSSSDPRKPLNYFLGEWSGVGTGKIGDSKVERSYKLILNEKFIQIQNRSTYAPQEKNPQGEVHEDFGLLSFDTRRQIFILREFHVEGYVNQYFLESLNEKEGVMVFVTEAIENIPPGWRARTTYKILNDHEFQETFDLLGPEKDWACYITIDFKRQ